MRLCILRSARGGEEGGPYTARMDTAYADRVIGHLSDKGGYCAACGGQCKRCRAAYGLDHSHEIADVISFPSILPVVLEDPEEFLPPDIPDHDVLLAIAVHEQILMAWFGRSFVARGVIVPREETDWISPSAMRELQHMALRHGTEIAFPKPFCSLAPPAGGILAEFCNIFFIGRPDVDFTLTDGRISRAVVRCSAPCGATYFTARRLIGAAAGPDLRLRADACLSAFPCTAGHALDRETGDSVMHKAVQIQRGVFAGMERMPEMTGNSRHGETTVPAE